MATESSAQKSMQIALGGREDTRVFRNQVGAGWMGNAVRLKNGDVLVKNARFVEYGLCVGSSDLIGLRSVLITEAMVGQVIAVFVGVEAKSNTGSPTKEQRAFINMLVSMGAYAGVAKTDAEALRIIRVTP